MPFRLAKTEHFCQIAASSLVSYSQYLSAVIVLPHRSSSKWIIPLQSHQTHSNIFIGGKPAFVRDSAPSAAFFQVLLRCMLLYKIHFSSPITNRSKKNSLLWRMRRKMVTFMVQLIPFSQEMRHPCIELVNVSKLF